MDHKQLEEPQDDDVIITDLNPDGEDNPSNDPRLFLEPWLFSPKYRRQRTIVTAICIGLVLLMVLFAIAPVNRLFQRGSPPTAEPSISIFGLNANPPWGSLIVDGKHVALSSGGAYSTFSLSPGQHTLIWQAAPFAPQQCHITIPLEYDRNTCQFTDSVPQSGGTIRPYISFQTDLSTLSSAQRSELFQLAQTMLDLQQSSEMIGTGELYARTPETAGPNTRSCTVLQRAALCFAVAREPLLATLHLHLDTNASCAIGACDSGSQNCQLFCDLPAYFESNFTPSPTVWLASVPVQLLWQFSTKAGRIVEENQADSFILGQQNAFQILLNITWNGSQWSVTINNQNNFYVNEDPVCQAASGDINTLLASSSWINYELQSVQGLTPASGCLLKITKQPDLNSTPTPTSTTPTIAYVIQRFGISYAVNATARRLWPFLPIPDVTTQHIAQQLIPKVK